MLIPRSWTNIQSQSSPEQTRDFAEPTATDIRWKLAALFNFFGWLTIVFSLRHSIKYYKPRNRGLLNRMIGFVKSAPNRFLLTIPLCLVMVGYEAACAFKFDISPLKLHPKLGYMYGLGWGPIAAIFLVQEIAGFWNPNEDRELIHQRRVRDQEIDVEMGIVKKPHWWSRLHGDPSISVHDSIARNVREVGGGRPTTTSLERAIEMGNMPVSKKHDVNRPFEGDLEARESPFRDTPNGRRAETSTASGDQDARVALSDRNDSTDSGVSTRGQPQQIRSMLDV
jgi:hypothetical protein